MGARTDSFDLGSLDLSSGEARRLELEVALGAVELAGEPYVTPQQVAVVVDVSRMVGGGYALRLRTSASLSGPCMRCLEPASPQIEIDSREVDQPGGGEELSSPYLTEQVLDVEAWAHDAMVLALPAQINCREDCAGLCPDCGENLNEAGADHHHEARLDPRWAALRELRLE